MVCLRDRGLGLREAGEISRGHTRQGPLAPVRCYKDVSLLKKSDKKPLKSFEQKSRVLEEVLR